MTVVVTGASGHIGANLIRTLTEKGRKVRVLVRRDTRALDGVEVERVAGDVSEPGSLRAAFEGAGAVFHLAGCFSLTPGRERQMIQVNVAGTRNVAAACLEVGVNRLVHFSSVRALAQTPIHEPVDEARPPADVVPCAPYDQTKAQGEREVRAAVARGLHAVIVNPTGVVGPHDYKPSAIGHAIQELAAGRFPALITGGVDWVDVRDVVQGALLAEARGRPGERYILGGQDHSLAEVARLVGRVAGRPTFRPVLPLSLARVGVPLVRVWGRLRGTRPILTQDALDNLSGNRCIRHDKATGELGYKPRPLPETLADTLRWFQDPT